MSTTVAVAPNKIKDILNLLGVHEVNSGVSTGAQWLKGEGVLLESLSPVDGALIGAVMVVADRTNPLFAMANPPSA